IPSTFLTAGDAHSVAHALSPSSSSLFSDLIRRKQKQNQNRYPSSSSIRLFCNNNNSPKPFLLSLRFATSSSSSFVAPLKLSTTNHALTSNRLQRRHFWLHSSRQFRSFPAVTAALLMTNLVGFSLLQELGINEIIKVTRSDDKDNEGIANEQVVAKLNNETNHSTFAIIDFYKAFLTIFKNKGENPDQNCENSHKHSFNR
ncbi:unnamed protein product, partial [Thlaspi arvense]